MLTLEKSKAILEILAYGSAAVFLLTKLVAGQLNPGMEVSVELNRTANPKDTSLDILAVQVKLKRTEIGRLEINDVMLEVSTPMQATNEPKIVRNNSVVRERKWNQEGSDYVLTSSASTSGTFMPPGDATQLAYLTQVPRGVAVQVDATILATKTGPWFGKPQWRASAISLPLSSTSGG